MYARSRATVQQVCDLLQDLCGEMLADCTHDPKRLRVWRCTVIFRSKRLPILYTVPTCQRHELGPIMVATHEQAPTSPYDLGSNGCCPLCPGLDKLLFFLRFHTPSIDCSNHSQPFFLCELSCNLLTGRS